MKKREETMWSNLRKENVELYREVRRVYLGEEQEVGESVRMRRFGRGDLGEALHLLERGRAGDGGIRGVFAED